MTQQPPSELTGFTVSDGFSVIPPKRPATVTVAAWAMPVVAVGGLVAAVLVGVDAVEAMAGIPSLLTDSGFHNAALLVIAAIVTVVLSQQARRGAPAAQSGTFVVLGTCAVLFGSMAAGRLVALPFLDGADLDWTLTALALTAGCVGTALPVVLLGRRTADDWFADRRRERAFDAPSAGSMRPPMFITGIGFLVLTGMLHIAGIAVYTAQLANLGVGLSDFYADLLAYYVTVGLPVLLLLTVTIGLAVGARAFLVLSYGLCGYFCLAGLAALVQQALLSTAVTGFEWSALLNVTLTFLAAAAAGVALFGLTHRSVVSWFDARRAAPSV